MPVHPRDCILRSAAFVLVGLVGAVCCAQDGYFGAAKVRVDPLTPIMLSGYAGRSGFPEASAVEQSIFAQAAAFGVGAETSLLLTVDCTGLPDNVVDPLRTRLGADLGIAPARIVMASTHSHSGPCISGYLPNLFGAPLSPSRQQHVDQYTSQLAVWIEQAATEALGNRTPGHEVLWANGSVGFGQNRRGASVNDHDLPVMLVQDAHGDAAAIITSYATHAVTLNGGDNLISGDWPGYAREAIEAKYPGATAMVLIGAGADSNPSPLGTTAIAQQHGQSIADEVERLVSGNLMSPVSQQISAFHDEIELDYATSLLPGDPESAMLAAGPSSAHYGVTSWTFGKDLAMVFMEGEVVADYSLRLKDELGEKIWVNGYSNDVQGYIPSERILYEGGYEADSSNYYYGNPGRYAHGLEDKIVGAVHEQLSSFTGIANRLRLVVDWGTGAVTIANLGEVTLLVDGYTVFSADGRLDAAYGAWQSFQDQGLAGWDEADNSDSFRITEFNPLGSRMMSPGTSAAIGRPFVPIAPAKFGDDVEGAVLTFEYSLASGVTETGLVQPSAGALPINNLVLSIDPDTGAAAVRNASPFFDVAITAYTISSSGGNLLADDGWNSLADQGLAGWDEADNSGAFRLTEFNVAGATLLAEGAPALSLGSILDTNAANVTLSDLQFEFLLSSGETLAGVIEFASLGNNGDFNSDGAVDGADFLVWQRTFGMAAAPAGSGADANGNGIVDADDLVLWRSRFGAAAATAQVVGEPTTAAVALGWLPVVLAGRCRSRGRRRMFLGA